MADISNDVAMENGDGQEQQFQQDEQPMEEGGDAAPVEGEGDKKDAPRNRPAGRTIIVKNLPASLLLTVQDVLKEKFQQYGELQYVRLGGVTVDFDTIVPTLAAYINFTDPESSEKAMIENGTEIEGYPIQMQILKTNENTMVVSNVPYTITEDCIRSLFSSCGNINKVIKIPARPTVFVEFETEEGLQQGLSLNGTLVVNNIELILQKQGEEKKMKAKSLRTRDRTGRDKNKQENNRDSSVAANNTNKSNQGFRNKNNPRKNRMPNRMGGGMGMMGGNNRNWGGGNIPWGMGYGNWDMSMGGYNNSWGNGNNYGGGNNGPRGNKRKKNDWLQY